MQEKEVLKPKTTTVTTEVPVTIYVAEDGKEFTDKTDCLVYERILRAIVNGQHMFEVLNYEMADAMIRDGLEIDEQMSDLNVFIFKSDELEQQDIANAVEFLRVLTNNRRILRKINAEHFVHCVAGKKYIVAMWIGDEDCSDYPTYNFYIEDYEKIKQDMYNRYLRIASL